MERLHFRVLGPLEVVRPEGLADLGSPRQQKVLALLLSSPNKVVSTDRLIDEVWGQETPDRAKHSLQTYISNLRRELGPVIETKRPGYLVRVEEGDLDSAILEGAINGDASAARDALALWRGEPFAGLTDDSAMLAAEAARLTEQHLGVLEVRIDADLAAGAHAQILSELEGLTAEHPLREHLWAALMTALYRSGRQSDGLRAYQRARRVLSELGIEPSRELRDLEERILLQDPELNWQPSEQPPETNLPAPLSSFIGRQTELAEVTKLLEESRLLTITGAGGSGKTRLALEVGAALLESFPDGVWLVSLGPLPEGSLITAEVLGILGLDAPVSKTHLQALIEQLADRQTLLILDNCEHLREEVAPVVEGLLQAAPSLKVLATSRAALGVAGEADWKLGPLGLPALSDVTPAELAGSEAARLFLDRASIARPAFRLDDSNARHVAGICHQVDGLPLAIELAAARTSSLGVDEIDRRLEDRFQLLTRGKRGATDRHQTLLGAIEWSYELLDPQQQELYARLSVFRSGFTLEAAESVGVSENIARESVLDLLADLVSQSLVVFSQTESGGRYRMLETIRAHALIKLGHSEASARNAHLAWTASLGQKARRGLAGPEESAWTARLQVEQDNVREALSWALENDPIQGLAVTTAMAQFWFSHSAHRHSPRTKTTSYIKEGADWSKRTLDAATDAPAEVRARALVALGGPLQIRLGEFAQATENLREAEVLLRPLDLPGPAGWAVHYQGISTWGAVPWEETVELFRRAMALFSEAENRRGMLFANMLLGYAMVLDGSEVEEGIDHVRRFTEAAQRSENPNLVAHAAYGTALVDLIVGHDDEGTPAQLAEAITGFDGLSNLFCLTHTLQAVALYHAEKGELERAARVSASAAALLDRLAMVYAPYCGFWPSLDLEGLAAERREAAQAEGTSFGYQRTIEYVLEGLTTGRYKVREDSSDRHRPRRTRRPL